MKSIRILVAALSLVVAFGACKKDKPLTFEQKLLGKWTWVRAEDYHIPADINTDSDTMNPAGAFIEFLPAGQANNLLYDSSGGGASTTTWVKVDNTHITMVDFGNLAFKLDPFSSKELVLTASETVNGVQHIVKLTLTKP